MECREGLSFGNLLPEIIKPIFYYKCLKICPSVSDGGAVMLQSENSKNLISCSIKVLPIMISTNG
ncbi:ABC-F family ATPase, partial [Neisseria gonorrhoeae]